MLHRETVPRLSNIDVAAFKKIHAMLELIGHTKNGAFSQGDFS